MVEGPLSCGILGAAEGARGVRVSELGWQKALFPGISGWVVLGFMGCLL